MGEIGSRMRRQWVVLDPCGCAVAVMEDTEAPDHLNAIKELYEDAEERERWFYGMDRTIINVSHETYVAKYYDHMLTGYRCPHQEKSGFWRQFWKALTGRW
jgi:hypothetical protein